MLTWEAEVARTDIAPTVEGIKVKKINNDTVSAFIFWYFDDPSLMCLLTYS